MVRHHSLDTRAEVMRRLDALDITEGDREMNNPWRGAPPWALDLLEMQYFTVLQNEEILAKLHDRSTRLSDADQRALDQLVGTLKDTNTKIDDAKKDN